MLGEFLIVGGIIALISAAKDGNSTGTEDTSSRYDTIHQQMQKKSEERKIRENLKATFPTKSGHSF